MKARMLSGDAMITRKNTHRRIKGQQGSAAIGASADRMAFLLEIAQQMGGPLNVVLGRMEQLLDRKLDREARPSVTAIISQVQQLIELHRQLIDETRNLLGAADPGPWDGRGDAL